jgi:HK97 family phage prohead protease
MKHIKLFSTNPKSIDETKRQVTFCFSDDSIDRMGEKVDQASWDTKNYMNNPVILWGHNPDEAENVIGKAVDIQTNVGGKSYITAQFDTDEHADLIFNKIKGGILRTVSAGFIPHTIDSEDDIPVLKDNELLEVSIVAIPANANAFALSLKEGSMSTKDAAWFLDSMKRESDALQKQLDTQSTKTKEKQMTDEQYSALMDALTTQGAKVDELATQVTTVTETLTTQAEAIAALKPAEVIEDDKEEDTEDKSEDDTAKDGGNDQSGADAEEFDPESELTPEQEAELRDALDIAA